MWNFIKNEGQKSLFLSSRSYENVSQFKYLGITVTNENLIQEETKRRLKSGNACYHFFQNLLSSSLLSKNLKIGIYIKLRGLSPLVNYTVRTTAACQLS
jgi:hypothetical protein